MKDLKNKRVQRVQRVQFAHTAHTKETKLYSMLLKSCKDLKKLLLKQRVACAAHTSTRRTRLFPYLLYVELFSLLYNFDAHSLEKKKSVCSVYSVFCSFLRKIPTFGKIEVAHA